MGCARRFFNFSETVGVRAEEEGDEAGDFSGAEFEFTEDSGCEDEENDWADVDVDVSASVSPDGFSTD